MDLTAVAKPCSFGDKGTSDVVLRLRNSEGRPEWFYSHSSVLVSKSGFFADRLSNPGSGSCIEIHCSDSTYDHHVNLLRLLYLPTNSLLDSLDSVQSALGVLPLAIAFRCENITNCCIQYLEAVPWEDKEEEQIVKEVLKLGPVAMPILARIQPMDLSATKSVFISAVRFATSIGGSCPPFGDELKTSAQEQVEFMLGGDEDTPLVTADDEVKSVVKSGLSQVCSLFENELSSFLLVPDITAETAETRILQCLSDVEWMCNILPKMDLMKDFVCSWGEMSRKILEIVEDKKLDNAMWVLKVKLIEVTGKVLEAVGYGNVILPAPCRVQLLKTWLPYIRKIKPLLDAKADEDTDFPYKMDEDLCQSIEGAIVSLVLALPSNDQADILSDWMKTEQLKYPDLSEAFEVGASALLVINDNEELYKMVCSENDTSLNISIPVVMIPKSAGDAINKSMEEKHVEFLLYAPTRPIVDFSVIFLWAMAVGTIVTASLWQEFGTSENSDERYNELSKESPNAGTGDDDDKEILDISVKGAIVFVITASTFLVLLYFFMSAWFVWLLIVLFCIGGVQGMHTCIMTPIARKCRNCPQKTLNLPLFGEVSIVSFVVALCCLIFAVVWAVNRRESYSWASTHTFL